MQFNFRYVFVTGLVAMVIVCLASIAPPANFTSGTIFIESGDSLLQIASSLKERHLIAHPQLLRLLLRVTGKSDQVQTGAYQFNKAENLVAIAYRLVKGDYRLPSARVTLIEGMTVRDYAEILSTVMPSIARAEFISAAKQYEGYLFPDTYLLPPGVTPSAVIEILRDNFTIKVGPLNGDIIASGHSQSDIVIMASLVEKEARTDANRRLVAGVLWNRVKRDMPLQVDAVFGYIFNRDTYSPSFDDLKVDSPYNTYIHRGLPPTPIDNPGIQSIKAAINPTPSTYLYYLTDTQGVMHYAETYDQHLANQRTYLK
ncbi:MAG: Endolytic murein transglycosylase [Parcubacteria group bacterium]|nr:Endolytic murein transglycosylase [Parcubacteria group bacterium]